MQEQFFIGGWLVTFGRLLRTWSERSPKSERRSKIQWSARGAGQRFPKPLQAGEVA